MKNTNIKLMGLVSSSQIVGVDCFSDMLTCSRYEYLMATDYNVPRQC